MNEEDNVLEFFSIIIPVYNSELYIEKCLNSILKQQFENFEVILIDDGSSDNSAKIIKSFKDHRIRYYYQKNLGPASARNNGAQRALGKYIIFVDSDDYLSDNALNDLAEAILKYDADMVVYNHIKFNGEKYEPFRYSVDYGRVYNKVEFVNRILDLSVKGYIADKVFKASIWHGEKIRFTEQKYCEDWFPVLKYATMCERIVFLEKPVYYYRQHEGSLIHKSNANVVCQYSKAVKDIVEYLRAQSYDDNKILTFQMRTSAEIFHELFKICGRNAYSEYEKGNYGKFDFKIIRIIASDIPLKTKLSLLAWKTKTYTYLKLFYRTEEG